MNVIKGKIKTRLVLIMTALVIVPLVVSSIVSMRNTINTATESAYETNAAQASIVEERINKQTPLGSVRKYKETGLHR